MNMNQDGSDLSIEQNNGNIAGRDINIYRDEPSTLWDLSTKDLKTELARCSFKKSEINKKFMVPMLLMVLSLGALFVSLNFKLSFEFFLILILFGIGFPAVWVAYIEKTYKAALVFYQVRINNIKLILQDRM